MATSRSLVLLACGPMLHALLTAAPCAHAAPAWTGSIGATTDYIYRGVSQTNGAPAAYAGLRLQSPQQGWSAGVWSSTVDLNRDGRTGLQLDLHAARWWSLDPDWTLSVELTHRDYISERAPVDYDHNELAVTLSFQQRVSATVSWSPDAPIYSHGARRGGAIAYELALLQPLTSQWSLFAGVGVYDHRAIADDAYAYWSAGVAYTWSKLQLDFAHVGAADAPAFSGYTENHGRWTGSLTVRF